MLIEKYSFGIGDRFGQQGSAQLAAIQEINKKGIEVVPVWNKSFREHSIVHTEQKDVLAEAKKAVKQNDWTKSFYVDADHIGMGNVDKFIDYSNFFTIDVAHYIGQACNPDEKEAFLKRHSSFLGNLSIPGIEKDYKVNTDMLGKIADTYLKALMEVKTIYDYIERKKGKDHFIAEVSMDECDIAQSPIELFFILAELKYSGVKIQTIAPKFTGLFPKGVDYVGDVALFSSEFEQDVAVIKFAIQTLGLPCSLKLSVHSGSDKFSIYPAMKKAINKFDSGIHVKTAGTTWLEEVIGLSQSGEEGLKIAKTIYRKSLERYEELTGPYASVLDLSRELLPSPETVDSWTGSEFANKLIHDQNCPEYDRNFRQLIHVGYKIAAEMGDTYLNALTKNRDRIYTNVSQNIYKRHLELLFS